MVSSEKKSSSSISPWVAPVGDHLLDFALDGGGMALHLLTAQCGVVQHLLAPLGAGVEHHALAEDRRHERVGLGLVEFLVGGAEEELVGLRAGQQTTCLSTSWNEPTSPHSSRTRRIRPIGSVRNSSRWPCSSSPPETRWTSLSSWAGHRSFPASRSSSRSFWRSLAVGQRCLGLDSEFGDEAASGCLGDEGDRPGDIGGAQEIVVAGLTPLGPVFEHRADRLGGHAPAHRGHCRARDARPRRAPRCPRVPSADVLAIATRPALAAP